MRGVVFFSEDALVVFLAIARGRMAEPVAVLGLGVHFLLCSSFLQVALYCFSNPMSRKNTHFF